MLVPDISFVTTEAGKLWRHRIDLFVPIWSAATLVFALLAAVVVPRRRAEGVAEAGARALRITPRHARLLGIVFFLLACYVAFLLSGDDFTYYDNSMFTLGTLAGHPIAPPIWPDLDRFFPLAFAEYNVLRHFTRSALGYHALHILYLFLLSLIMLSLDRSCPVKARAGMLGLLLVTPSIVISFSGLIYPEWSEVFWLLCAIWCIDRFERGPSLGWAMMSVVCAQIMLYYKETAFLLLLGFSIGRLLFRRYRGRQAGADSDKGSASGWRIDAFLLLLVTAFLLYYLAAMYPAYGAEYASRFRVPLPQVIAMDLKIDLLAWVLFGVTIVRVVQVLRRRQEPDVFWDGLALGGVTCFAGYLYLRLQSAYYFAPVDVIAILYLGRRIVRSWDGLGAAARGAVAVLLIVVTAQSVSLSAFRMYEKDNVVGAKAAIARQVKQLVQGSIGQNEAHIFFPYANATQIMEFSAYLTYLGVAVERDDAAGKSVMVYGKAVAREGRCVFSRVILCHPQDSAKPGDLIVSLPDDVPPAGGETLDRSPNLESLFSYQPQPAMPEWLLRHLAFLRVVSPVFFNRPLPATFLHGSVGRQL